MSGFYLIDSLLAGDLSTFAAAPSQLALPALTLSLFAVAPLARATRAAMLEVLSSDFVRTARAIPLSRAKILFVYAFGNALLPVLTTIGMVFSFLLGANVLVEKVFGWPGIGSYAIDALIAADYAPVQGFVLLMAILYILLNLLIDIAGNRGRSAHGRRVIGPRTQRATTRLPPGSGSLILIAVLALTGALAPWIAPYDPLATNVV